MSLDDQKSGFFVSRREMRAMLQLPGHFFLMIQLSFQQKEIYSHSDWKFDKVSTISTVFFSTPFLPSWSQALHAACMIGTLGT